MATNVLSSSPSCSPIAVTPPHTTAAYMSSSPGLPSPSQIISSMRPGLASGSRATLVPPGTVTGFASASALLRKSRPVDEPGRHPSINHLALSMNHDLQRDCRATEQAPEDLGDDQKKLPPAFKRPREMPREMPEKHLQGVQEKFAGVATAPTAATVRDTDVLASKKSRKKKSKNESESQTTIKKAKVTKPGAVNSCKKAGGPTKKPREVDAAPFRLPASTQEEDLVAKKEFRDLCLEKAITRRREWTPCKDTVPSHDPQEDFEKLVNPALLVKSTSPNEQPSAGFGNLLGEFGFAQKDDGSVVISESTCQRNGEAIVKRRKIELVNAVHPPRVSEEPKKCKPSKKKPQTVTEKATAPFASVESMAAPSLLQYFGAPTTESIIPAQGPNTNSDTPVTVGTRFPVKKVAASKPKSSKTKKQAQKQPILLSPESAMKDAKSQELIFGTSSQLLREESPTLIRDLQQAMKESEPTVEQNLPTPRGYEFLDLPSGRPRSTNVRAILASKSLWSAASRDIDGSLIETETVDLVDTPKPVSAGTGTIVDSKIPGLLEFQPKPEDSTRSPAEKDVSIAPKLSPNNVTDLAHQPKKPDPVMPRSVAEAALRNRPKSISPVKKTSLAKPATDQMPNYEGFTDVQLRKAVTAYGFKTIKKRETMIKKLEQCWESQKLMALQEIPANVNLAQPLAEDINTESLEKRSPSKKKNRQPKVSNTAAVTVDKVDGVPTKKPRGRPKKDPTAAATPTRKRKAKAVLSEALVSAADDEIYDSSPPTPSPRRKGSPPKSPGQLQLSQPLGTSTTHSAAAIKGKDRALLFSQITKAVTTFPPTHDPKNMTWYEKILMYDPIILEDLTVWLNTEGLGRVDEDDEVSPDLVKEWCEQKSVCCVWRENLRGGSRGRW